MYVRVGGKVHMTLYLLLMTFDQWDPSAATQVEVYGSQGGDYLKKQTKKKQTTLFGHI